jgi:hypothetical protein
MTLSFRFTCASRLRERIVSHFRPVFRKIPDHWGEIEDYSRPKTDKLSGDPDYRGTTVVKLPINFPKRNSHMPSCAHAIPLPCRAALIHTCQCRAPAILRQCRVLRESPRGSRKYPNC